MSGGAPAPLHLHLSDEPSSDYYERYKTSLTASYPLPSRETPEPKYHGIVETYREIFDDLNPTTQDGGGGQGGGGDSLETSPSSLQQCPVEVRNEGEESTTPRGSPPSERVVVREGVQVLDDLKKQPALEEGQRVGRVMGPCKNTQQD